MPDLGDFAAAVLSSYGVTIVLLAALIALSARSARQARARLNRAEQQDKDRAGRG